ncbi:hypothetical protein BGY98DRAFT_1044896, partial [Russula aff. rugulosa BPL654]
ISFSASESVLPDLQSHVFRLATIVVLVFHATLASSHCMSASRSNHIPARPRTSTRVSIKGNSDTTSSPKHVPLDEPILPLCT